MEEVESLLTDVLNSVRGQSGWSLRAVADALLLAAAEQSQPELAEAPSEAVAPRSPLSAEQLAKAVERYSTPAVLRTLLTHDPARGGVPIRLVRASWLLTHFQANTSARLEHRQHLERNSSEAFVEGAMLERVLAELVSGESYGLKDLYMGVPIKEGVYMTEVGGEYKPVKDGYGTPLAISFPSAVAMSHMCAPPPRPPSNAAARGPAATH